MIPANAREGHRPDWQREAAGACTRLDALLEFLGLEPDNLPELADAAPDFPLRVPWAFVRRMRRGDPHDPLLRQVLPLAREREAIAGFVPDPVGDRSAEAVPGLLHKYRGRALLTVTGACAVHCRYCFRRHFPYAAANPLGRGLAQVLDYLRGHPDITEIILSGGDPLSLDDARLDALISALEGVPSLRRLRLHTRQPVVLPSRVTPALVARLCESRLRSVMVLHVNHPAELDGDFEAAIAPLREAGIPLYNQAVLLRGVNDSVATQQALAERLFECGIQPLYVHQLDRVAGAAHFEVPEHEAIALFEALRARLPGYLMPRLVRERPGAPAKHPLV